MPWYVITREYQEIEGRSLAFGSEPEAIGFALGLMDSGVAVLRVEGEGEEVEPAEMVVRFAALYRRR